MSSYFDAMRTYGFSNNTTASVRKSLTCPRCGFAFSLVYARTFACQGCSEASLGCPKVRCAKCDCEFPIESSSDVFGKVQERTLADHMGGIVTSRNDGLGIVSTRRRGPKPPQTFSCFLQTRRGDVRDIIRADPSLLSDPTIQQGAFQSE